MNVYITFTGLGQCVDVAARLGAVLGLAPASIGAPIATLLSVLDATPISRGAHYHHSKCSWPRSRAVSRHFGGSLAALLSLPTGRVSRMPPQPPPPQYRLEGTNNRTKRRLVLGRQ